MKNEKTTAQFSPQIGSMAHSLKNINPESLHFFVYFPSSSFPVPFNSLFL